MPACTVTNVDKLGQLGLDFHRKIFEPAAFLLTSDRDVTRLDGFRRDADLICTKTAMYLRARKTGCLG